jgi:soluble cytochrome b562
MWHCPCGSSSNLRNGVGQADTLREKDAEKTKLDGEKKKLEEELGRIREQLKKALTDGALTETKQKELAKLASDRDRVAKELLDCRNDLDSARKAIKAKEEDVRRKEADLQQNREGMKLVLVERDDIKKERDELETKVLKQIAASTR